MVVLSWRHGVVALLLGLSAAASGWAQTAPVPTEAPGERLLQLPLEGEPLPLPVRLQLPPGAGPFPLALVHHERRYFTPERPKYEAVARYFLAKGFAVALPVRAGYGELEALGDRESLSCTRPRPDRVLLGTTVQTAAVLEGLSAQGAPIDRARVLHVGVGVGGFAALGALGLSPQGALGAINFGGVLGAHPERFPGEPCGVDAVRRVLTQLGRAAARHEQDGQRALPTLWLYAEGDRHVAPRHARRWHAAYRRGGGRAELQMVEARSGERPEHPLPLADAPEHWQAHVDRFLQTLAAGDAAVTTP